MSDTLEVITSASQLPKLELKLENCLEKFVATNLPNHSIAWKENGVINPIRRGFEITPTTRDSYSAVYYNGFCSYETNKVNKDFSIKGAANFCEGDSIVLSISEANNIKWSGPKGFEGTKAREVVAKATAQNVGQYEVQFEKSGCLVKESLQVTMKTKRKGFINRSDKYCANQPITMFLDSESISFPEKKVPDYVATQNMKDYNSFISYSPLSGVANGKHSFFNQSYSNFECSVEYATDVKVDESPDCPALRLQSTDLNLCRGKNKISFETFGKFPENEIFDLYSLEPYSSFNNRKLATVTSGGKIEFELTDNTRYLYVEGRKSGAKSNVVIPNISYYNIYLSTGLTFSCKNEVDLEVLYSNEVKNFSWSVDGKALDFKTAKIKVTQSGVYKVVAESSLGCIQEAQQTVDITPKIVKPFVSAYPFRQSCDSVTLVVQPQYFEYNLSTLQYQWLLNGKEIAGATSPKLKVTQNGAYTLKKIIGECTEMSDPIDVVISELPKPILRFGNSNINENPIVIQKNVVNNYLYTTNFVDIFERNVWGGIYRNPSFAQLQWTKDGEDLDKENNYFAPLQEVGTYQLRAKVGSCVAFSDPVKVIDSLKVSTTLSKNKICSGEKVTISYVNTYDKSTDFYAISQESSIKVFKDNKYYCDFSRNLELDTPGEYFLQFEPKDSPTFTSSPITLTSVANSEPFKLMNQSAINICSRAYRLSVESFPTTVKPNFKWFKDNEVLTNEFERLLTISESGVYRAEVSLEGRCPMVSEPLTVNFNKIDFTLQQVGLLCASSDAILRPNIIGSTAYLNESTRYFGRLKLENKEVITDAYALDKTITKPGTYTYTLTQGTCSAEKSITVQAVDVPRAIAPNVVTLTACPTTPLSFGVQAQNAKYTWTYNGNTFANNKTQNIKTNARGTFTAWIEKDGCARQSNLVKTADKIDPPKAQLIGLDRVVKGSSAELSVVLRGEAPWTVTLNDGTKFVTSKSNYRFKVRPTKTTTYELASVQNNCGVGLVSGKAKVNVFSTAGTEATNLQVGISPNPVEDYFDLDITLQDGEQQIDYQIYNNSNHLIEAGRSDGSTQALQKKINFSNMPAGTYLLRVQVGEEVVVKRILKMQ
jgi:hypothetical protein